MLLLKRNCLELRYAFPVIVFSILLFLYVYVSIGNRRELALFLVFVLLLSVGFKKNILTFAIVAAFPVLLALGLIRALSGASLDEFDLTTNLLNLFGEFVFPHYALLYYSSLPSFQFEFGRSFFLLPAYAFPSFGLWEKSKSLSVQFAYDFSNLDMGYALTPLAEGYINFGWSAMVLSPLLLALSLVLAMRFANIAPFTLLIIFSFPLDISRGEFTTIFFQFVIFSFVFYLVAELFQFKVSRIGK